MRKNKRSFVCFILFLLVSLNVFAWMVVFDLVKSRFLEISFFNVGQGDAIFIVTPQQHQILIDGGPDTTILEELGGEMPFYDRSIDLIVLTHPEHDHMAGLIEVLKRYEVENILWTGVLRDTAEFQEWERALKTGEAKIKIARAGQKIVWSSKNEDQGFVDIFFPLESLEGSTVKNTNNTSIVAKLTFKEKSFLFTGDAYKSVERKLLEEPIELSSEILKVGHHGSKTSTSEEFLREVLPQIAVISVGSNNSYGHPHPETLAVLKEYDINVLRTDQEGNIKILTDGYNLKIKNK
jgi:competence protein ComEC